MTILIWLWKQCRKVERLLNQWLHTAVFKILQELNCPYLMGVVQKGELTSEYYASLQPFERVLLYEFNLNEYYFFLKQNEIHIRYHQKATKIHIRTLEWRHEIFYQFLMESLIQINQWKKLLKRRMEQYIKNHPVSDKRKEKYFKNVLQDEAIEQMLKERELRKKERKGKDCIEVGDVIYQVSIGYLKIGSIYKNILNLRSKEKNVKIIVYLKEKKCLAILNALSQKPTYGSLLEATGLLKNVKKEFMYNPLVLIQDNKGNEKEIKFKGDKIFCEWKKDKRSVQKETWKKEKCFLLKEYFL